MLPLTPRPQPRPPPRSSLDLANKHRLENVAFPAISTGVYGYPKEEAAEVGQRGQGEEEPQLRCVPLMGGAGGAMSTSRAHHAPRPICPPLSPPTPPRPLNPQKVALKAVQGAAGGVKYVEFVLCPTDVWDAFVVAAGKVRAFGGVASACGGRWARQARAAQDARAALGLASPCSIKHGPRLPPPRRPPPRPPPPTAGRPRGNRRRRRPRRERAAAGGGEGGRRGRPPQPALLQPGGAADGERQPDGCVGARRGLGFEAGSQRATALCVPGWRRSNARTPAPRPPPPHPTPPDSVCGGAPKAPDGGEVTSAAAARAPTASAATGPLSHTPSGQPQPSGAAPASTVSGEPLGSRR
jgi:hypothetical protein